MGFLEFLKGLLKKGEKQTSLNIKMPEQNERQKPRVVEVKKLEVLEREPPKESEVIESYAPKL